MTLPFKLDDGGCSASSRPHSKRDCVVAAIAIVVECPYDLAYDTVALAGRKPDQGFESDVWLKKVKGRVFGGQFKPIKVKIANPVGRKTVLTPSTFGLLYPKGHFLLETRMHVWAYVDGYHHDIALPYDKPLTGAWQWHP